MLTPFSSEDLGRVFDARALTRGRTLILLGAVEVTLQDPSINVVVEHLGLHHTASIRPSLLGQRVTFLNRCSCGQSACAHLAAGALFALDRYPALRKPVQNSFLDTLTAPQAAERQRLVFELSPGEPPHPCFVATVLIGERTGRREVTTPGCILADRAGSASSRLIAKLLGGGDTSRTPVASGAVTSVLSLLARIGKARWHATGKILTLGGDRTFQANVPPDLPPKSAIILGETGPWYVDGATGALGRIKLRQAPAGQPRPAPARPGRPAPGVPKPRTAQPACPAPGTAALRPTAPRPLQAGLHRPGPSQLKPFRTNRRRRR